MRILVSGNHPLYWGGLSKASNMIIKALLDLGHEIEYMVTPGETDHLGNCRIYEGKVYCFLQKDHDYKARAAQKRYEMLISVGDVWSFIALHELSVNLNIPWVAYFGCEGLEYPDIVRIGNTGQVLNMAKAFETLAGAWVYTDSTRLAISKYSRQYGFPVDTLFHYYEEKPIKPIHLRKQFNIADSSKIVLYVGVNTYRKGPDIFIDTLLKSLKQGEDWVAYMHMPGFNPWGIDVEAMYRAYPILKGRLYTANDLNAKLKTDYLPDEYVRGLYEEGDLFFHPHRGEGFGLCVLEALMSNIRVQCSPVGGPSHFAKGHFFSGYGMEIDYLYGGQIQYRFEEHRPDKTLTEMWEAAPKVNKPFYLNYPQFKNKLEGLVKKPYEVKKWRSYP